MAEGARLEIALRLIPVRGFESLSLRQIHEKPARDAGFFLAKSGLRPNATSLWSRLLSDSFSTSRWPRVRARAFQAWTCLATLFRPPSQVLQGLCVHTHAPYRCLGYRGACPQRRGRRFGYTPPDICHGVGHVCHDIPPLLSQRRSRSATGWCGTQENGSTCLLTPSLSLPQNRASSGLRTIPGTAGALFCHPLMPSF